MAFKKVSLTQQPTTLETLSTDTTTSFKDTLYSLFKAHHLTKAPIILWGKSGFGKSSTVRSFAKDNGYNLEVWQAIALDPLTMALPVERRDRMDFIPNESFHRLITATEPTILLIDEVNKFSNPSVENMLNSLILEREYNGFKLSDSVLIVGTANFVADSQTAQLLDFSIINRCTNIMFSPDKLDIVENMQSVMAKGFVNLFNHVDTSEESFRIEISDRLHISDNEISPRQLDAIGHIIEKAPWLSEDAVKLLCIGRIGNVKGIKLFEYIRANRKVMTVKELESLYKQDQQAVLDYVEFCNDLKLIESLQKALNSTKIDIILKNRRGVV